MFELRLGDIVDDYCVKCRRVTNHAIVSMVGSDPAKVRCRTCYHEHDFRRCEPPPKKESRKEALFREVLSTIDPEAVKPEPEPEKKPKGRKKAAPES